MKAIVIGGGIAGCSTAYALAKRGIQVTLIERHAKLAQEASGNPTAMLYPKPSIKTTPLSTLSLNGFEFTLSLLKKLPTQQKIYDACGQIQLAFNAREFEKQTRLAQLLQLHQYFQFLNAREASEVSGLSLDVGGMYLPQASWVKPVQFCEALASSSLITKALSTKAVQIERCDSQWQVSLDGEQTLEAGIVVLCNANDVRQFEPCAGLPITPVRGQVNFFADNAMSKSIKTIICSDHYLSPSVDGFNSIGTSYAPNDINSTLSEDDTHANMLALRKISAPLYHNINPSTISGRVAWRSSTKDFLPLAGQLLNDEVMRKTSLRYDDSANKLPWLKGLYINAGHGSKGMITAPLCGELIANLVNNESLVMDTNTASKLSPNRFLLKELGLKKLAQSLY